MDVFQIKNYREIIQLALKSGNARRPRGSVAVLAKAMQCHSTLVAHILNGKSHMTCEQGIRAAGHFDFSEAETDYFLTLILWERAGDKPTKSYFSKKLQALAEARVNLRERWKVDKTFSQEQEEVYYSSWIPMAVHLLTHLDSINSESHIAEKLRLGAETVKKTVSDLLKLGLLQRTDGDLKPTNVSVHLGKGSPALRRCHLNIRQKVVQDLTNNTEVEGSNYSSFVTLTKKDAKAIRELVIRHIEEIRQKVTESSPEVLYLHCVDFFEISQ